MGSWALVALQHIVIFIITSHLNVLYYAIMENPWIMALKNIQHFQTSHVKQ